MRPSLWHSPFVSVKRSAFSSVPWSCIRRIFAPSPTDIIVSTASLPAAFISSTTVIVSPFFASMLTRLMSESFSFVTVTRFISAPEVIFSAGSSGEVMSKPIDASLTPSRFHVRAGSLFISNFCSIIRPTLSQCYLSFPVLSGCSSRPRTRQGAPSRRCPRNR